MEKDFKNWHILKENLDTEHQRVNFGMMYQTKQLWVCSVGVNVGSEQDGHGNLFSRPVLIFRVFSTKTFWGIPITTKGRKN
ncbi:MAG: hypothetical protein KGI79_03715, partial [Patescibacteria group bacterium]|nr:hypothetical protein [Patescibacteria group bacterium]